jgi:hypothetical protein
MAMPEVKFKVGQVVKIIQPAGVVPVREEVAAPQNYNPHNMTGIVAMVLKPSQEELDDAKDQTVPDYYEIALHQKLLLHNGDRIRGVIANFWEIVEIEESR